MKKITSTTAKSEDGTIQITFTIPWENIESTRGEVLTELAKDVKVEGFRPGKAPKNLVEEKISPEKLLEQTLTKLLPKALTDVLTAEKIKPLIYPKFEIIKNSEGEDWQVRAITCELPEVDLGNYKELVKGALASKSIWTPKKGDDNGEKEAKTPSREEKEQEVINVLLQSIKPELPKVLVDEEVNSRLSKLLERIEKLGLTLESYLASIGKTSESLRAEYLDNAINSLRLDLILQKVAEAEKIEVKKEDIDNAIKASSADPSLAKSLDTPEQRRIIEGILKRRASLDYLTSLI